jgi:hypothetical protein
MFSTQVRQVCWVVAIVTLLLAATVIAQSTTGTISGHVTDRQGLALPGVTVSVISPALQGTRTAVTSEIGDLRDSAAAARYLRAYF